MIESETKLESMRARKLGTVSRRQIDLSCRSFAHSPAHAIIQNGYRSVHFSQDKSRTKLQPVKAKMGNFPYFSCTGSRIGTGLRKNVRRNPRLPLLGGSPRIYAGEGALQRSGKSSTSIHAL